MRRHLRPLLALACLLAVCGAPPRAATETVLSARSFGAAGDGIADDTAALQAALDALPPEGGRVELGAGEYRLSAPLELRRAHATLAGIGTASVLSRAFSGPDAAIVVSAGDAVIAHLALAGTGSGIGIQVLAADPALLSNLLLADFEDAGIAVGDAERRAANVTVRSCRIRSAGRRGIHLASAADVRIQLCWIDQTETGIHVAPAGGRASVERFIVEDSILDGGESGTSGIDLDGTAGTVASGMIYKNLVRDYATGLRASASSGVTFSDNWVYSGARAFDLVESAWLWLNGNVVNSPGGLAAEEVVRLQDVRNVEITRNDFWSPALCAVRAGGRVQALLSDNRSAQARLVQSAGRGVQLEIADNLRLEGDTVDRARPTIKLETYAAGGAATDVVVAVEDAGSGDARAYWVVDGILRSICDAGVHRFFFDPGSYSAGLHIVGGIAVDRAANSSGLVTETLR
jgi:hypothetical protein